MASSLSPEKQLSLRAKRGMSTFCFGFVLDPKDAILLRSDSQALPHIANNSLTKEPSFSEDSGEKGGVLLHRVALVDCRVNAIAIPLDGDFGSGFFSAKDAGNPFGLDLARLLRTRRNSPEDRAPKIQLPLP